MGSHDHELVSSVTSLKNSGGETQSHGRCACDAHPPRLFRAALTLQDVVAPTVPGSVTGNWRRKRDYHVDPTDPSSSTRGHKARLASRIWPAGLLALSSPHVINASGTVTVCARRWGKPRKLTWGEQSESKRVILWKEMNEMDAMDMCDG